MRADVDTGRRALLEVAAPTASGWTVSYSTLFGWVVAAYLLGGVSFAPYLIRWYGSVPTGARASAAVHIEDHRPGPPLASVPAGSDPESFKAPLVHRTPSESAGSLTDSSPSGGKIYVPRRLR